jgi:hypothetical protein
MQFSRKEFKSRTKYKTIEQVVELFPQFLLEVNASGMCNSMLELCLNGSIMGSIPTQVEDGLHLFIVEMMQHIYSIYRFKNSMISNTPKLVVISST